MAEEDKNKIQNCPTLCNSFDAEYIPLQKYDQYTKRYDGLGTFSKDFPSLHD